MQTQKAYLLLADGTVFEGRAFGATGAAEGECVFTTALTGYQETLTDPSYTGQLVCQTFPTIGNYGLNSFDWESSRVWPRGYIVREWCPHPSNFRSEEDLDTFLKDHGIPGICGIDTRALTRRLRREGTLNAAILPELPADKAAFLAHLQGISPLSGAVRRVSRTAPESYPAEGEGPRFQVLLYDFGTKDAILRQLAKRGCEVTALPCDTPAAQAAKLPCDGILLSSGPGDPADVPELVEVVKDLVALKKPLMGICLGHQLLARALGAKTQKLPFGHRGENQPVTDLALKRTFITCQNHGYAVVGDSVKEGRVSHVNANDGSVEGIAYPELNAFSVQFHPEASAGPQDTAFLFDQFVKKLAEARK